MTVKVRQWNGDYYIVAHFQGKRKSHKCKDEADAKQLAKDLIIELKVLGKKAFQKKTRIPTFSKYSRKWLKEARSTSLKQSTVESV